MHMHLDHLPKILLPLLVAVVLASAAVVPARAIASPAELAAGTVTEGTKVTLHEISIDGPGFAGTDIAWTGTDPAHHLNIRTGTDGLHFPNKTTLPETSPVGPALITPPTGFLVFAWTGTDANHSLNVEFGPPNSTKLTLHESSFAAPAIAFGIVGDHGEVLLAWTGTDANHSLNVLPITRAGTGGLTPGKKTVLSQFSSDAGPSLVHIDSGSVNTSEFVLGWSASGTQQLNLAEATDGATFTNDLGAGLPQISATAPQFLQPNGSTSGCIAWTGTDAAHHLNVQCTTQFPQFPDPAHTKTVLSETALGAPGFIGNEIAWTGTDAAHHLNVAQLHGL